MFSFIKIISVSRDVNSGKFKFTSSSKCLSTQKTKQTVFHSVSAQLNYSAQDSDQIALASMTYQEQPVSVASSELQITTALTLGPGEASESLLVVEGQPMFLEQNGAGTPRELEGSTNKTLINSNSELSSAQLFPEPIITEPLASTVPEEASEANLGQMGTGTAGELERSTNEALANSNPELSSVPPSYEQLMAAAQLPTSGPGAAEVHLGLEGQPMYLNQMGTGTAGELEGSTYETLTISNPELSSVPHSLEQPITTAPTASPDLREAADARLAAVGNSMYKYLDQIQTGTGAGTMGSSNQELTNSNSALGSVPQVRMEQAPVIAVAKSSQLIANSVRPLMEQSQVILRRNNSERETRWSVLAINLMSLYNASFCMPNNKIFFSILLQYIIYNYAYF